MDHSRVGKCLYNQETDPRKGEGKEEGQWVVKVT